MALYYKVNTDVSGINQNDKARHKKSCFLINFETLVENDSNAGNEKNNDYKLIAIPLNSENFKLRNIQIFKDIYFSGLNVAVRSNFYSSELGQVSLPTPKIFESLFVGFSDQDVNAGVINIQTYCQQTNYLSIPFAFNNFVPFSNNFTIDEMFNFGKNKVYLNAFITHQTANTGDVTDYWTMLTAKFNYAGIVLDQIKIRYSIFVYGVME